MRLIASGFLHEHDYLLIASLIGATGAITAAWIANKTRRQQRTGNGHQIGKGVAHIEELLHDVEDQLDRVEIQLRETKWSKNEEEI
jgi:archaellum component FlaC